jgi:hypothetical protein
MWAGMVWCGVVSCRCVRMSAVEALVLLEELKVRPDVIYWEGPDADVLDKVGQQHKERTGIDSREGKGLMVCAVPRCWPSAWRPSRA